VSYALYKCQDQRFLQLFLLAPGPREGWGLVVTEANAMGTPAVAYDVLGLYDSIVEGVTGKLVAKGNSIAMAIDAVELLKGQVKLKAYSINALHNYMNFDWKIIADRIAEIFYLTLSHHFAEQMVKKGRKYVSE
jgi:glycosyltransferase involved in cell wall biosynthesis